MESYSQILLHEANTNFGGTQNTPISNDILVNLTKTKLEDFTIPSSGSGVTIEKVVKVVMAAQNFIGSALQSEPHAAIAWAGVSMFLPVSTIHWKVRKSSNAQSTLNNISFVNQSCV